MSSRITIPIEPVAKPRMTRADKWKRRDCVLRYRAFCDELRLRLGSFTLPDSGWHATFYLPVSASWSAKKKRAMEGQPHRQKPDVDNLCKSLLDALFGDDSHVWDGRVSKRWSATPRIEIETADSA